MFSVEYTDFMVFILRLVYVNSFRNVERYIAVSLVFAAILCVYLLLLKQDLHIWVVHCGIYVCYSKITMSSATETLRKFISDMKVTLKLEFGFQLERFFAYGPYSCQLNCWSYRPFRISKSKLFSSSYISRN